jgi:hypothetical protein
MQKKLEMEEQEKVGRTLNMISPDVLNKNFSKDVVNAFLPQVLGKVKELSKAGVSDRQAREEVFTVLSDLSEWSNKSQTIDDQIEEQVKGLDNTIYDVGRIKALAKDMAKYSTVGKQKILKGKDEMDPSKSYVSMVIEEMPDLAVDERKAANAFQASLKAIPEVENVTEEVKDANGRRVGEKVVEKLSFLYDRDPNNNIVLKKDDKGFVPEETFQTFYSQYKPWIDGNAKRIMSRLGVPESPEATEWFRRSFLTDTLERSASGTANVSRTNVTQPRSGGGSGADKKSVEEQNYINAYQEIDNLTSSKKKGMGAPLTELALETQNVVLGMAKSALGMTGVGQGDVYVKKENDGTIGVYTGKDILNDDNNVVRPINSKIGTLTSTGTNVAANKPLGQKAKAAAAKTKSYVIGGKNYSMDDLKKIGYTEDQVNQAIKAGTVKLK